MSKFAHAVITTLTAAIVTAAVIAIDPYPDHAEAAPSASSTKPNVKGKRSTWGSTLSGTSNKKGRLASGRPTTTPKPHSKTKPAASKPAATKPPAGPSGDRRNLRINIGICGRMQPDGTVPGPTRCQPGRERGRVIRPTVPPKVVPPRPEDITWEQVRSETKNVVFPGLSVKVQPSGKTIVNMATVVYTEDSKVSTATVTLLGFPVVVEATPISYTWDFGDGSPTVTTSTPGKPYPDAEITHKYKKREGVGITVTTNYAARFNVADTGWQYIEGTVPITGPATLLQVREAVPVLVDPGR